MVRHPLGSRTECARTDPQPGEVQSISSADAGISVYVVGVDEEAVIAEQTLATVE